MLENFLFNSTSNYALKRSKISQNAQNLNILMCETAFSVLTVLEFTNCSSVHPLNDQSVSYFPRFSAPAHPFATNRVVLVF